MIKSFLCLAGVSLVLAGCVFVHETETIRDKPAAACSQPAVQKLARVLRHVVLLKCKDDTNAEQIAKIENGSCALPGKIHTICNFEWGTDVSVENRRQGFTHCFVFSFHSEADRDEYLSHPAHKEFVEMLGPHIDKILVIDYWPK